MKPGQITSVIPSGCEWNGDLSPTSRQTRVKVLAQIPFHEDRMRKLGATIFCLLFAGIAGAQSSGNTVGFREEGAGNMFFGYSYYNTNLTGGRSSLNGWNASLEVKVLPLIGIVGDFSAGYGSLSAEACTAPQLDCGAFTGNISQYNFLFGPRVSVQAEKIRPFAEVLFGGAHVNVAGSNNSFATAIGGGLDYKFAYLFAWRFQGDYVHTHLYAISQNNVRISTGIVVRF